MEKSGFMEAILGVRDLDDKGERTIAEDGRRRASQVAWAFAGRGRGPASARIASATS
ncbi:hypothetical protein MASR1M6_24000 [Rubrivivax sp.]